MGEFSVSHVLILTVILLVFFGPSRLPALGQSIGKAIRGFKEGMNEVQNEMNKPGAPQPVVPPTENTASQPVLNSTDNLNVVKKDDKSHQNNS